MKRKTNKDKTGEKMAKININIELHREIRNAYIEFEQLLKKERDKQLATIEQMNPLWSGKTKETFNEYYSAMLNSGDYETFLSKVSAIVEILDSSLIEINKYKNWCDTLQNSLTGGSPMSLGCASGNLMLDPEEISNIDSDTRAIESDGRQAYSILCDAMSHCGSLVDFGSCGSDLDNAYSKLMRIGRLREAIDEYASNVEKLDVGLSGDYANWKKTQLSPVTIAASPNKVLNAALSQATSIKQLEKAKGSVQSNMDKDFLDCTDDDTKTSGITFEKLKMILVDSLSNIENSITDNTSKAKSKFDELKDYVIEKYDETIQILQEKRENGINDAKGFIPQKVDNITVLGVMEWFRELSHTSNVGISPFKISKKIIMEHSENNTEKLNNGKDEYFSKSNYIENQLEWSEIQFGTGKSNMSWSGCEIIATYNALNALGEEPSADTMVSLISNFEEDGAMLAGFFGTSPKAIYDYFSNNGYHVSMSDTTDADEINEIGENYDTVIVTAYNDANDITKQVHTVSITKKENGTYVVHNIWKYEKGKYVEAGGYNSLNEAIGAISENPEVISIIGIDKKVTVIDDESLIGDFPEPGATLLS
jgi:hypothetical protein